MEEKDFIKNIKKIHKSKPGLIGSNMISEVLISKIAIDFIEKLGLIENFIEYLKTIDLNEKDLLEFLFKAMKLDER